MRNLFFTVFITLAASQVHVAAQTIDSIGKSTPAKSNMDSIVKKPYKSAMQPGKVDITLKANAVSIDYNLIVWTPVVKAGIGYIDLPGKKYAQYGGFFLRPLQPLAFKGKDKGELIIGFNYAKYKDTATNAKPVLNSFNWDLQAEYRFKFGLCLGGGVVKSSFFESPTGALRNNDYFFKASYRGGFAKEWKYNITGLVERFNKKIRGGAYAAIYGPYGSLSGGYDFESYRVSLGLMAKKDRKYFKPAAEVLFIDKTIGFNRMAPRIVWFNGTLKFTNGFLSNESRLGRSMGPTGLEYGNPLSFLTPINDGNPIFNPINNPGAPIWNRALNTWELGGLLNARLLHFRLPNKSLWGMAEVTFFPFQFMKKRIYFLENVFVGSNYAYYVKVPAGQNAIKSFTVETGFTHRVKSLGINLEVEYNINNKNATFNAGIINWF